VHRSDRAGGGGPSLRAGLGQARRLRTSADVVEAYADSCGVEVAPVRVQPDEIAEQVTQALLGEPLRVEERRRGWARVRTSYGCPGWIREEVLCGSPAAAWPPPGSGREPLEEARAYLGAPYAWGGMTVAGIDCSGLVHMAFRRAGRIVPRDAHEQEDAGLPVKTDALARGDVVTYGGERADHVAFWLGDGRILHATDRAGVHKVLEEPEPRALRARRRRTIRL
jgi:gamma-D-glutamyl-L-lysine dipeptidyl-peptidase